MKPTDILQEVMDSFQSMSFGIQFTYENVYISCLIPLLPKHILPHCIDQFYFLFQPAHI